MRRNYIIKIFIYVIFSQMELGEGLDSMAAACLAVIFKLFSSFLSPMHIKFMPRLWIAFRHSAIPEVCARDANDFIWVCDEIRSPEAESRVCDYSVLAACHES